MTTPTPSDAPRVLVLRAPGINCERETAHAFERAGATCEFLHVKRLRKEPSRLDGFQILAFPGGFAYGDDIAAGRVLAHELRRSIGDHLLGFVERGGLVLGICNGFQALVRLGLLPRTAAGPLVQEVSLAHNLSDRYECRWVTLTTGPNRCVFLPDDLTIHVPAAHGEGRIEVADPQSLDHLEAEGYVAFRYVDENRSPTEAYPLNPNGSPRGIAGLTDVTGRVLGLMPHPDRAYEAFHAPRWRSAVPAGPPDGMTIFRAMVDSARGATAHA